MSLSFTNRRNLYGKFTRNTTTDNLDFGDTLMNAEEKRVINSRAWDFTQRLSTQSTVASQQFYNLPVNYRKLIGKPTITVGSITYTIPMAPDRQSWDRLTSVSNTSDIPQWAFLFNKQIGFYPTPASSGNTITLPYEIQPVDLSIADHSTGTIVSITNGATTITGTAPAWTDGMAGKFIRIDDDNSADSGDNEWYEIASVTSSTVLEIVLPYEGTSIAAATQSYTIAQLSIIPESYELLPIYKATQQYWLQNLDVGKSDRWKQMYDDLFDTMIKDRVTKESDLAIQPVRNIRNPNLFVQQ